MYTHGISQLFGEKKQVKAWLLDCGIKKGGGGGRHIYVQSTGEKLAHLYFDHVY